jgi:hypothetical protein
MTTIELIIDGVFFLLVAYHLVVAMAALALKTLHGLNR